MDNSPPPQGGADQRMPIIVSRVAPGTPVNLCITQIRCFLLKSGDVTQLSLMMNDS